MADPATPVAARSVGLARQDRRRAGAQGDLAAALTCYQASHEVFERLARADPGNAGWQRDLSVSHNKIGDVQLRQGDLAAALTSYQDLVGDQERLARSDPANAGWQRDLSISHERIGDVQSGRRRPGVGADELPGLARDQRAFGEGGSWQFRVAARRCGRLWPRRVDQGAARLTRRRSERIPARTRDHRATRGAITRQRDPARRSCLVR